MAEIIPKFTLLLQRKRSLCIHGDGKHTRRFLYAGDAADAIDTIIHKGEIGQFYNVDSKDEICNLDLAKKLLGIFNLSNPEGWIQHTMDRPFNDRRYAVDGTKLRKLGWTQRMSFEEGLLATVNWYEKFSNWWGPIDNVLTPFPVVEGDHVVAPESSKKVEIPADLGASDERDTLMSNGKNANGSNGVDHGAKKRKIELMA